MCGEALTNHNMEQSLAWKDMMFTIRLFQTILGSYYINILKKI